MWAIVVNYSSGSIVIGLKLHLLFLAFVCGIYYFFLLFVGIILATLSGTQVD